MRLPRHLLLVALAVGFGAIAANPSRGAESYSYKTVTIGGGGFVTGVVFHPTTPNLIYSRTDVGGAYRWDETAQAWIALNDDIGGLNNEFMTQGVLSVALDPVNNQRVYLATGQYVEPWAPNAAILSSIDRGATWTKIPLPIKLGGNQDGRGTGERLQVDPNQPRILYLGTSADGVWRSADNAKTWSKVASFPEAATTFVLFDKSSASYGRPSQTIYVGVKPAVAGNPSLFRSVNGGTSWQAVLGQPLGGLIANEAGIGYKAQNSLYLAYADSIGPNGANFGAVWKLNTATGVWTNITPPTGQGGFSGLSVGGNSPDTLAVSTLDRWWPGDEIYRSVDGGATWKAAVTTGLLDNSPSPWSVARNPHWTTDVDIDPFNPDRALFVTGYGIWGTRDFTRATNNQTVHWEFLNEELEETVPLAIVSPKAGTFHLYSSLGDIGGFRHRYLRGSPPAVDYFQPYRGTTRSIAAAEENSAKLVRTVDEGTRGQISIDSGATFAYFGTAAPGATTNGAGFIDIAADGNRIVWMPTNSGVAFSPDNGANWTPSIGGPAAGTGSFRPVADRVNAAKFYILQPSAGALWTSLDGGTSFQLGATGLPTSADVPAAVPGFEGNLWMPGWWNGLYRSTDSGLSFTPVSNVQEGYRIGFGKAAEGQSHPAIYLWGKVNNVVGFFRSDDAGATWVRVNDDKHQFGFINQLVGDPRVYGRFFLATSGRGIVYGQPEGLVAGDELPDPNDPVFNTPAQHVYIDALQSPWSGDGWGYNTLAFNNSSPAHAGPQSIRATFNEGWGIVRLTRSSFVVGASTDLKLWVHGGSTGGQGVSITARLVGDVWLSTTYRIPKAAFEANTWTEVTIPLSALGLNSASEVIGFAIGNYDFSPTPAAPTMPTFYLDDVLIK